MVNLIETLESTAFHDADLAKCVYDKHDIYLHFRNICVEWGREEYYSAVVTLRGVRSIRRLGTPIGVLTLEGEGSDVLQFHRGEGQALLLIEWHHYDPPQASTFAKYEIGYATSDVAAEKQDELIV